MTEEGLNPDVEVKPDAAGKLPEIVPISKYVGVKEAWGRAKEKVSSLEEQLKKAPNNDEFNRIKTELDTLKTEHQKVADELRGIKDKSVTDKKEVLKARGITDEDLKDTSDKELDRLIKVTVKGTGNTPKPDLGSGGGNTGTLKGSPLELAAQGYTKK